MLKLLWSLARDIKESWEWVDLARGLLAALGLGPLIAGVVLGVPLDVAMAWGLVAIAYWVVLATEGRPAVEALFGKYRGVRLEALTGTSPDLERLTSVNPPARLMRIGIRNPGHARLESVAVEVVKIADVESVWPDGGVITLPYTLRQSRDHERLHRRLIEGLGGLRTGGRSVLIDRDLKTSFQLDAHATEYLDFAHGHDGDGAVTIYSTSNYSTTLQPQSRYVFTLFIHGGGVRPDRITLVCEQLAGRWRLRTETER